MLTITKGIKNNSLAIARATMLVLYTITLWTALVINRWPRLVMYSMCEGVARPRIQPKTSFSGTALTKDVDERTNGI
jgi:hypothetical protein